MEWHEAVGAASAILTFVTFSYDAIKVFREVADKGSTAENDRSALLAEDSKAILDNLGSFADSKHDGHAAQISKLARECHNDGKRLVELLDKLKILSAGRRSSQPPRKSIRTTINETANRGIVTVKSIFGRGEIKALEERLSKTSSAIVLRLTALLNERQLASSLKLESIRSETQQRSQALSKQMTSLEKALSKLSVCQYTTSPDQAPQEANTAVSTTADAAAVIPSATHFQRLSSQVEKLLRTSSGPSPEMRILKQLYFPSLYHREDHMKSAEQGTFEWILNERSYSVYNRRPYPRGRFPAGFFDRHQKDEPEHLASRTRLISWLQTGHGVFHVSGKAGAGKSTLMKLLVRHGRVQKELRLWAAGKTLLFGHFFFWRSGDRMQNSLEGLYRSILFETLSKSPELLQHVFPEAYRKFSRTTKDECIEDLFFRQENLRAAAQRLVGLNLPDDCRLCLFIDGLDEYGEDGQDKQQHEDLARLLLQWSSSDRVKLLVSSRPEKEFNIAFSNPDRCITLHTLTRQDIQSYAGQSLQRHREYGRIAFHARTLTAEIASRAEGVFVWAKFAVNAISRALRDGLFDIKELLEELNTFPDEMDKIYSGILKNNKSPRERRRACWLLQAVCNVGGDKARLHPLFVLQIDHWHDPSFPFSFPRQTWTRTEARLKVAEAVSRVTGLSGGLVELQYDDDDDDEVGRDFNVDLQPFHRTLRDFVFGNSEFTALVTETEKTYTDGFFFRIAFTNVWFSCIDFFPQLNSNLIAHLKAASSIPPDILLNAFEPLWVIRLFQTVFVAESIDNPLCEKLKWSFRHFAISKYDTLPAHRMITWADSENETKQTENLSLLVSAALGRGGHSHARNLEQLLGRLDPNRRLFLTHRPYYCGKDGTCPVDLEVTVWMAICMSWKDFTRRLITGFNDEDRFPNIESTLCNFINAGADCDFFILYQASESFPLNDFTNFYAVSAPDTLMCVATRLERGSNMGSSHRGEQIATSLEGTEMTMPMSDEWAQHGIILADEWQRQQLEDEDFIGGVCGLARGVRKPEGGSVSLEVTWIEDYHIRIY